MSEETKQMITLTVLDRTGHAVHTVDFEGALELCRKHMAEGRWLYGKDRAGKAFVETNVSVFETDFNRIKDRLSSGSDLRLGLSIMGGQPCNGDGSYFEDTGYTLHAPEPCVDSVELDTTGDDGTEQQVELTFKFTRKVVRVTKREDVSGVGLDDYKIYLRGLDAPVLLEIDTDVYQYLSLDVSGPMVVLYLTCQSEDEGEELFNADEKGETRVDNEPRKVSFKTKLISEPNNPAIIAVTADTLILNNASGREAFATAAAKIIAALEQVVPELMRGEATVEDGR